jgi:ATP/maltotriose-dependent transcriptional regulator MalT
VPLVTEWLQDKNLVDENATWLNHTAEFYLYLLEHERETISHAIITHHALRRAERHDEANRLTLDWIVGSLTRAGFYRTLLEEWLPRICESKELATQAEALGQTGKLHIHLGNFQQALPYLQQSLAIQQQIGDKAGEGTTLNNISQIYDAQGDYETALKYLQQSLAIQQQIGDKAGLCATLFNMGHIHMQNNQVKEAVNAWVTVYVLAKQMNLAQALQALASLAPQLGLPEGLAGWENLAQRIQSGEQLEFGKKEEVSELEQIRRFMAGLAIAVKEKTPEAEKYFEAVSKMAVDPNAAPHYQELGKVLQKYMSGVRSLDTSALPAEIAKIIKEELG